jgi:hypothetical protein
MTGALESGLVECVSVGLWHYQLPDSGQPVALKAAILGMQFSNGGDQWEITPSMGIDLSAWWENWQAPSQRDSTSSHVWQLL